MTPQEFAGRLSGQLAIVIGTLVNAAATVAPAIEVAKPGRRWVATCGPPDQTGSCTVAFDDAGAAALALVTSGVDNDAPAGLVSDTLREMLSQALGALTPHDEVEGAPAWAVTVTVVPDHAPAVGATAFTISTEAVPVPVSFL